MTTPISPSGFVVRDDAGEVKIARKATGRCTWCGKATGGLGTWCVGRGCLGAYDDAVRPGKPRRRPVPGIGEKPTRRPAPAVKPTPIARVWVPPVVYVGVRRADGTAALLGLEEWLRAPVARDDRPTLLAGLRSAMGWAERFRVLRGELPKVDKDVERLAQMVEKAENRAPPPPETVGGVDL